MTTNLDIAFCVDNTGSMGTYIANVQANIRNIVEKIVSTEKADVRFALVKYRDFTDDYVVKSDPFTSSVKTMKAYVDTMQAQGGGDGPEAVASGLNALLSLDWRKNATRVAVFIADAPPHGLEVSGDSYPNGGTDNIDPFEAARALVVQEIVVYSVGCEPAINSYTYARDFMKAVADMSGGKYVSLLQASILPDIITGGASEEINLQKVQDDVEKEVERMQSAQKWNSDKEMYAAVASNLQSRGCVTNQLKVDEVVDSSAFKYASALSEAPNLKAAQSKIPRHVSAPSSAGGYGESFTFGGPVSRSSLSAAPAPYGAAPPSFSAPGAASPFSFGAASSYSVPTAYKSTSQSAYTSAEPISAEQIERLSSRASNKKSYSSK